MYYKKSVSSINHNDERKDITYIASTQRPLEPTSRSTGKARDVILDTVGIWSCVSRVILREAEFCEENRGDVLGGCGG